MTNDELRPGTIEVDLVADEKFELRGYRARQCREGAADASAGVFRRAKTGSQKYCEGWFCNGRQRAWQSRHIRRCSHGSVHTHRKRIVRAGREPIDVDSGV